MSARDDDDAVMDRAWPVVPLEELLAPLADGRKLHQGWSPRCEREPSPDGSSWGVLKTTAIQAGYFLAEENKNLPQKLTPREAIEVHAGDILTTCAGPRPRCGVSTMVPDVRPRLMLSGKMYRYRAAVDRILPRFLSSFMQTDDAWRQIDRMKTGGSDSGLNLTMDRFRGLQVPVPPLEVQEDVLRALDSALSRLENAQTSAREAATKSKALRRALIKSSLDGRGTDWPKRKVGEVVTLASGQTPKGLQLSADGDIPFYKVGDMNTADGIFMDAARGYLTEDSARVQKLRIRPAGTIIFPKRGGAIATDKKRVLRRRAAYDLNTMGMIPGPSISSAFLYLWFSTVDLARIADGSNVPQINNDDIAPLELVVPPVDEQERIVEKVEAQLSAVDALSRAAVAAEGDMSSLRSALFRDAFNGHLLS